MAERYFSRRGESKSRLKGWKVEGRRERRREREREETGEGKERDTSASA